MNVTRITLCSVFLVVGASFSAAAVASESDRSEVRGRVESGGWNIVWGKTIAAGEYAEFTAAAAASVATANPGPVSAFFGALIDQNIEKMSRNAPGVSKKAIRDALVKALNDRGREFRIGRVGIKGGIATYRYWHRVTVKVPDGTEKYKIKGPFGSWTWGYRPKYKTVTKTVPAEPNNHQPYFGFRLY